MYGSLLQSNILTTLAVVWLMMLTSAIISGNVANKREKIVRITIEHVDVPNQSKDTTDIHEGADARNTFLLSEEAIEQHEKEREEQKKKEIKANIIKKLSGILNKVKQIKQNNFVLGESDGKHTPDTGQHAPKTEIIPPASVFVHWKYKHKHHNNANKKHHFDQSAGMDTGDNILMVEPGVQITRDVDQPVSQQNNEPQASDDSLFGLFENGHVAPQPNRDATLKGTNNVIENKGNKLTDENKGNKLTDDTKNNKHQDSEKYNLEWKDLSTEIENYKDDENKKIDHFIPVNLNVSQQELLFSKKHGKKINPQVSFEHDNGDNDTFSANDTLKHVSLKTYRDNNSTTDISPSKNKVSPLTNASDNDTAVANNSTFAHVLLTSYERDNNSLSVTPETNENVTSELNERDNNNTIDTIDDDVTINTNIFTDEKQHTNRSLPQVLLVHYKGDNESISSNNSTALGKNDRSNHTNSSVSLRNESTVHDNSKTQVVNVSEAENHGNKHGDKLSGDNRDKLNRDKMSGDIGDKLSGDNGDKLNGDKLSDDNGDKLSGDNGDKLNRDQLSGDIGDKNDWGNGTPDIDSENKHYWDDERKTKVNINNVNHQRVFKDFSANFFYKSMKYDGDNSEKLDDSKNNLAETIEKSNEAELRDLHTSVMSSTVSAGNDSKVDIASSYAASNESKVDISAGNERKVDISSASAVSNESKIGISSVYAAGNEGKVNITFTTESTNEHLKSQLNSLNSKRQLQNRSIANNLPLTTIEAIGDRQSLFEHGGNLKMSTTNSSKVQKDFCAEKHTGSYANDEDCTRYWLCAGGKRYETQCPGGLVYNSRISTCDDPSSMTRVTPACIQRLRLPPNFKVQNEDTTKRSQSIQFFRLK